MASIAVMNVFIAVMADEEIPPLPQLKQERWEEHCTVCGWEYTYCDCR